MLMPVTKRSYRSYQHLSRFRFIILENPISVRNYSSDLLLCQKEIPASCRGILAGITDPQLFLKVPLLILLLVKVPFFNKISLEMVLAFQERRQSYGCQRL